jgi:hypothetical protein
MLKKSLSVGLAAMLTVLLYSQSAAAQTAKSDTDVSEIRNLAELYASRSTKLVVVKLKGKGTFKGYVKKTTESNFVLVDRGSGNTRTIDYVTVKSMKRPMGNAAKIGLGVIAGFVVLGVLARILVND